MLHVTINKEFLLSNIHKILLPAVSPVVASYATRRGRGEPRHGSIIEHRAKWCTGIIRLILRDPHISHEARKSLWPEPGPKSRSRPTVVAAHTTHSWHGFLNRRQCLRETVGDSLAARREEHGRKRTNDGRTHARTHAARTERGGAEVNASRSPKFLGQPVVRATRSTELVDPRRWVVVAPVTSIPAEALQSKRPMPKTHTTRELSLSPTSSSRYPNARQFQRDSHSFSIFSVRPSHRISTEDGF